MSRLMPGGIWTSALETLKLAQSSERGSETRQIRELLAQTGQPTGAGIAAAHTHELSPHWTVEVSAREGRDVATPVVSAPRAE